MKKIISLILISLTIVSVAIASGENTHTGDLESSSSQYYSAGDSVSLSITGDMTIEMYRRFESVSSTQMLIAKATGGNNQNSWSFIWSSGNELWFGVDANGANMNEAAAKVSWTPSTDTWYHISVVYDASEGSAKFYIDGVQQGATQTGLETSIYDGTANVLIGVHWDLGAYFADGLVDDVRIYNVARTESEIASDYNCELTDTTGLVAYWKLNNNYNDSTGNGNGLTAYNSPVFQNSILPFTDACGGAVATTHSVSVSGGTTIKGGTTFK